ncbi:Protein zds1 like protein [Verticillium longisporum]|nr:Protein zds1 like protein [Verticillium longisporum]
MMTSSRPRGDVGGSFASRRGHASQLSISDPSHHVTEAIGTLYGDEDDYTNDHRPMSFIHQPEHLHKLSHLDDGQDPRRQQLLRSTSDQSGTSLSLNGTTGIKKAQTLPTRAPSLRLNAYGEGGKTPLSPTMSLRDVQNESSQFPLTNIEHPNDIAQELSNLQALRRMSMDVGNNTDPDLLPFSTMSLTTMPSMAPSGDDDEADPSRLLWVPAAVHPELAPTEFKNFLENRVQSMKRRSGESLLSPDTLDRSNSGGLRRKKSMLSRQIDNSGGRGADGYVDGSVKLDGKRTSEPATELSLDDLMKDPTGAVQKLAQESQPGVGPEGSVDDMPILPMVPGMGLRRSTRTTYRKGADDRKADRKSKKDKDDESSSGSTSKSWSKWLKGSGDDKEKKKRDEEKKKSKIFVEKAQDNVRLDVLQNSIESAVTKGRESLLLDRDNVDSKLAEERKKESSRKSDPAKKEKEGGGLFSGLFGGGKKKGEKESSSKKGHHLRVSEDPVYRPLRPDVDYHWTRFPLLEERAIYRMAHIKLANPRRSLSSQVLLSNFMYNYLAIVQAMHPQAQVPQSPQQRRLEEERRRKEQEEQYLAQQQLQQQQQEESDQDALDQYNFDYHRGASQYGDNNSHDGVDYVDDAQIYEYEHGGGGGQQQGQGNDNSYGDEYGGTHGKEYYDQYDQGSGANGDGRGRHSDGRDDMW